MNNYMALYKVTKRCIFLRKRNNVRISIQWGQIHTFNGDNEPMKTSIDLPYNWDCAVTLQEPTIRNLPLKSAANLLRRFLPFQPLNSNRKTFSRKVIPPVPRLQVWSSTSSTRTASCISNKSTLGWAKKASWKKRHCLVDFFGTVKESRRVLLEISDAEWERKTWYEQRDHCCMDLGVRDCAVLVHSEILFDSGGLSPKGSSPEWAVALTPQTLVSHRKRSSALQANLYFDIRL